MENKNLNKHISGQFNAELEDIRNRVLAMGGMVERQLEQALDALGSLDTELAQKVIEGDHKVNGMEVMIDEECTRIIAKRQPAASDLRLVIAISKTIADLERIGDACVRIAKAAQEKRSIISSRCWSVLSPWGAMPPVCCTRPWMHWRGWTPTRRWSCTRKMPSWTRNMKASFAS